MDKSDYLNNLFKEDFKNISQSEIFVVILTDHYIKSPYTAMQLGIAIVMDKSILLLVKEGCEIPSNVLKVAKGMRTFYNPDDIWLDYKRLIADFERMKE